MVKYAHNHCLTGPGLKLSTLDLKILLRYHYLSAMQHHYPPKSNFIKIADIDLGFTTLYNIGSPAFNMNQIVFKFGMKMHVGIYKMLCSSTIQSEVRDLKITFL